MRDVRRRASPRKSAKRTHTIIDRHARAVIRRGGVCIHLLEILQVRSLDELTGDRFDETDGECRRRCDKCYGNDRKLERVSAPIATRIFIHRHRRNPFFFNGSADYPIRRLRPRPPHNPGTTIGKEEDATNY